MDSSTTAKVDVVEDDDEKPNDIGTGTSKGERAALYERPVTFYKFGPKKTQSIAIDVSLNKLNKCIKVAYNKMTTPKWKDFKGLRLHWKQRIRLNNVIWRAYYIEFRMPTKKVKKKTPFCYFAVPDDDTTHVKLEGSVLEGMYWKRKMEAVCAQYKKWRHYMKSRRAQEKPIKRKRTYSEGRSERFDRDLCEPPSKREQRSQTPKNTSTELDYDDFENAFTDSLFASLNQPYMFPNPKEFNWFLSVQSGNADIMQPGLLSLQPSLEEIMASLGFVQSLNTVYFFPCYQRFITDRYDDEPNTSSRDGVMPNVVPQPASQSMIDAPQTNVQTIHPMSMPPQTHMSMPSQQRTGLVGNRGSSSVPRQAQDYAVASMLVDYSNQTASSMQMPTRQSSSITSQMLMMSSAHAAQPQYSTASVYNSVPRPSTPPSLLRSELRSPVVVRTMPLQHSPDMSTILSSPSTMSSIDPQNQLGRNSHLGMKQSSTIDHRMDAHMPSGSKEDKRFVPPSTPKDDWSSSLGSSLRTSSNPVGTPLMQNRSAPATAEVRSDESANPWKLSELNDSGMYSQPASYGVSPHMGDDSGQSTSAIELINMGAGLLNIYRRELLRNVKQVVEGAADKSEMKEEPLLMSAPSSVKPGRGGSRQVGVIQCIRHCSTFIHFK
ncbi:hypothetical protein OESDEN_07178, partial [Oesophagostomum dentatum]